MCKKLYFLLDQIFNSPANFRAIFNPWLYNISTFKMYRFILTASYFLHTNNCWVINKLICNPALTGRSFNSAGLGYQFDPE